MKNKRIMVFILLSLFLLTGCNSDEEYIEEVVETEPLVKVADIEVLSKLEDDGLLRFTAYNEGGSGYVRFRVYADILGNDDISAGQTDVIYLKENEKIEFLEKFNTNNLGAKFKEIWVYYSEDKEVVEYATNDEEHKLRRDATYEIPLY